MANEMLETGRPWINMVIFDELMKIEPLLELHGADQRLLQICCNDFWDYVQYLQRNTERIASDNPHDEAPLIQEFHIEADNEGNVMVSESTFDSPDIESVLSCVVCFVKTWWKKYKQRVKLTFEIKHQKQSLDLAEKGKLEIANQFTLEERHDIISMLTDTFMKYGEYCMARLLAENLFQRTIGSATKKTWSQEEKINLVTQMRREAKNISYIHGTLLYIQPNLKLYGLREWRNDGDQPKSLPPPP